MRGTPIFMPGDAPRRMRSIVEKTGCDLNSSLESDNYPIYETRIGDDSETQVRRISAIFAKEEPKNGQAQEFGHFRFTCQGQGSRTSRAVLQTALNGRTNLWAASVSCIRFPRADWAPIDFFIRVTSTSKIESEQRAPARIAAPPSRQSSNMMR
jgi:hypothetical protein